MNDATTREALIAGIAKRIDTFCEHVGYGDPGVTREEAESYVTEVEEALLADRAVPEPDAAAGDAPGLDELLDSVHPRAIIRSVWALRGGGWEARISVPEGPDDDGWYDYTGNQSVGTGETRHEAIADAVSKARKGESDV